MARKGEWTEAQKRASMKYLQKKDMLRIMVEKGTRERIQICAAAHGETVNRYVNRVLGEAIARDEEQHESK